MKSVKLVVTRKLYHNEGWGLFGCKLVNKEDKNLVELNQYNNITIKGQTPELYIDTEYVVDLEDDIERSPKGDSYNIIQVHIPKNTTSKAQYDFLKNIITKTQYENIIKEFPLNTKLKILDAIKNDEIDLTKVKGIKEKLALKIKNLVIQKEDNIYLYNKLIPIGVTEATINTIIAHYKTAQKAIERIDESLYNLCEVKGLGFIKVDGYALLNGEDKEGLKRIEACINYLIHDVTQEGHSWTPINEMIDKAVKLLNINKRNVELFLASIDDLDTNIINVNDGQITSKYYYKVEKEVFENLKRLNNNYKIIIDKSKMNEAIKSAQDILNVTYTDEQELTVMESFKHGVYIINGKGGSGKSTIMKGITEICTSLGLSYKAIALSGRAAQLLTLKGIDASTIHRLLKYNGKGFVYNKDNKLDQDVIILEEASMVNAQLWHSIIIAMKDGAKLIIVGDSGQLSGIGNGDVLRDLLQNKMFTSRELKKIHRQAEDSGIIEIASKVREGQSIVGYNQVLSNSYGVNKDMYLFTYRDKEQLQINTKKIINSRMSKLDRDGLLDFIILVSNKSRGEMSAETINKYSQSIYNDLKKPYVENRVHKFRVEDKVIISGNKYDVHQFESINDYHLNSPIMADDFEPKEFELYNGTIGIVEAISNKKDNESVLVKFEGFDGYIKIDKSELNDLDLAYAITVHKSQGVGCPNVVVLLDYSGFKLLSKQLVYTAITRASKQCILLAESGALNKACKSDSSTFRNTFVGQFIQQELNN